MALYHRKNLKPAKRPDDETLLRTAKASATRATNRRERERRAEQTLRDLDKQRSQTDPRR